jgi:hypothetical protein
LELLGVLAAVLFLLGFVGAFVPAVPGPPLSFLGLLCGWLAGLPISTPALVALGVLALAMTVADFVLPGLLAKRCDGTSAGVWGSVLGLLAGLLFPIPGGIFAGAFLGALIGEMSVGRSANDALMPALGSFAGVVLGTVGKVLVSLGVTAYFIYAWWLMVAGA